MPKYIQRFIISILLIFIGFSAGTVFGFLNGLGASALLESTPKGTIAVANLKAMESGKYESTKYFLETDVDQALALYPLQKEAWWHPAFNRGFLLVNPEDYERYIRKVATYRKAHPHPIQDDLFDKVPIEKIEYKSEYKELAIGIREYRKRVNETVEAFAEK